MSTFPKRGANGLAESGQIAQKAEAVLHRSSHLHHSGRENEKKEGKE